MSKVYTYGLLDASYHERLAAVPESADGPVYMLTLTSFRPGSGQRSGRNHRSDPDGRYAPPALFGTVGARMCFMADVIASPGGWNRVGVVRYPTRRAFVELTGSSQAEQWNHMKERRAQKMIMVGMVPGGTLPAPLSQRALLELWHGPAPDPPGRGQAAGFEVEGTYIGDGRPWTGARYTVLAPGTALPLQAVRPDYEALLVNPVFEYWV